MNKYPWINYKIDLRNLPAKTWIQLGECKSKCVHLSNIPLRPAVRDEMHSIYLAKGAQATTAIEGNTLTEEEVKLRIEKKLELPPSKEYLGQEIDNILELCNEISGSLNQEPNFSISIEKICRFNEVILNKVPLPAHVNPGKFRQCAVSVGTYLPPQYSDVPKLMERLCDWMNSSNFDSTEEDTIIYSTIKAIVAHLYIEWIHPFGDGNGRVGRILEFAILLSSGVPSPAAHLLSNHYNITRSEYYRHLDLASKKNDVTEFVSYAVQGFLDGLTEQLQYVFKQTHEISWESYIYEQFREENFAAKRGKRLRDLALELSRQSEPIQKDKLTALSQKIAEHYRNMSSKTLERDLLDLEKMGLMAKSEAGYRAQREKILAFLPQCTKK